MIAPLAGRLAKLPPGAFPAFVEGLDVDSIGDPAPIRAMLPRRRLSFREAAERALAEVDPRSARRMSESSTSDGANRSHLRLSLHSSGPRRGACDQSGL